MPTYLICSQTIRIHKKPGFLSLMTGIKYIAENICNQFCIDFSSWFHKIKTVYFDGITLLV